MEHLSETQATALLMEARDALDQFTGDERAIFDRFRRGGLANYAKIEEDASTALATAESRVSSLRRIAQEFPEMAADLVETLTEKYAAFAQGLDELRRTIRMRYL